MTKTTGRARIAGLMTVLSLATAFGAHAQATKIAAPAEPALQVAYSTDKFLTCDGLTEEAKRMDYYITTKGVAASEAKTASARKKALFDILKAKPTCDAQKKDFGPGMYD